MKNIIIMALLLSSFYVVAEDPACNSIESEYAEMFKCSVEGVQGSNMSIAFTGYDGNESYSDQALLTIDARMPSNLIQRVTYPARLRKVRSGRYEIVMQGGPAIQLSMDGETSVTSPEGTLKCNPLVRQPASSSTSTSNNPAVNNSSDRTTTRSPVVKIPAQGNRSSKVKNN